MEFRRFTLPFLIFLLPVSSLWAQEGQNTGETEEDTPAEQVEKSPEDQAVEIINSEELSAGEKHSKLQKLANENPQSAETWTAYGEALQDVDRPETALRAFEKASQLDPSLYTPWYRIGILTKRGTPEPDYARAERAFRKALEAGAPEPQALNELAVSLAFQGKMREAAETWQQAIKKDPEWGVLYSNLVKAALRLGDEELVKKHMPGAMAAERFEDSAILQYGDYLLGEGKEEEAVELYRQAIGRRPENPTLHFYLGKAYEEGGQDQKAVESLDRAEELLIEEGEDYQLAQAIEFERFRILHPDAEEQFQEARQLVFDKYDDRDEADEHLREAVEELGPLIQEHPDFWNGYFVRGVAHRRLNEPEKAKDDLRKVLEILPDEPNATMELALLLRDQFQFEEAANLADKAVDLAPRDPMFAVNAGLIMIEADRCDRAWELYGKAVRMVGEQNAAVLKDQLEIRCAKQEGEN